MASSQIVPHCEIKGVDVCGFNTKKVIIRSDLGVYIETDTFRPVPGLPGNQVGVRIRPLHRKCMNGDHYIATDSMPVGYWTALRSRGVLGVLKKIIRAIIIVLVWLRWGLYTMPIYRAQANTYSPPTILRRIIPPQVCTPQFYIVRGKEFSRVTDLTSNSGVTYRTLHPNCQGGKFYLASTILGVQGTQLIYENCFYIIFDDNNCLRVPSMCEAEYVSEKSMRFELHEECRNGLYYFGSNGYFFILKQVHCHWGLRYHRTTDLKYDDDGETIEIRMSVSNFLPGGLALHIGSISGRWLLLHKVSNINSAEQAVINIKVGFDKESCLKILNSMDEDLALSLFKVQLSLSPCYGGCGVDCSDKGWCTEIKMEEVEVQPGKSMYIWQYVHCLGEYSIFYHQEIAISNSKSNVPPIPKSASKYTSHSQRAATSIQSSESFLSGLCTSKPNLSNLTLIKWKNERGEIKEFRVKRSILHQWKQVGDLIVPRQLLQVWGRRKTDEECCDAVLSYWMDNPRPDYPTTWEGLYDLLKDSDLSQVASELKEAIDNAIRL